MNYVQIYAVCVSANHPGMSHASSPWLTQATPARNAGAVDREHHGLLAMDLGLVPWSSSTEGLGVSIPSSGKTIGKPWEIRENHRKTHAKMEIHLIYYRKW